MRVLLITGSFPPMKCGVGDYTANLAKALGNRENINVAVLTDAAAGIEHDNPHVEVFPVVHGWTISDIARIVKILRHWHPDVVHIQYPTKGYGKRSLPWLLPTLLVLLKKTVVQTWHEYYPMGRKSLPNAITPGGLVVVRPDYKDRIPSWAQRLIRRKAFRFIPNASAIPGIKLSPTERSLIHEKFTSISNSLVVFFGFVYPAKNAEILFEIADPSRHHLVLICDLDISDAYQRTILERTRSGKWAGKVTVTGFLHADDVSKILAAADAVVLPFRDGGGIWNTSIHGAAVQGTFILTTSLERHGYVASENIYYASPGDIADMRQALNTYMGKRSTEVAISKYANWDLIADEHIQLYKDMIGVC